MSRRGIICLKPLYIHHKTSSVVKHEFFNNHKGDISIVSQELLLQINPTPLSRPGEKDNRRIKPRKISTGYPQVNGRIYFVIGAVLALDNLSDGYPTYIARLSLAVISSR